MTASGREASQDVDRSSPGSVTGQLAALSVRIEATAGIINALRAAGRAKVIALTTSGVLVAPALHATRNVPSGVSSIPTIESDEVDPPNSAHLLSPRELQIVRLVADGWSNKAIGQQLSLSTLVVKNHLARVARKFGAADRAHIVAIAGRAGFIPGIPGLVATANRPAG